MHNSTQPGMADERSPEMPFFDFPDSQKILLEPSISTLIPQRILAKNVIMQYSNKILENNIPCSLILSASISRSIVHEVKPQSRILTACDSYIAYIVFSRTNTNNLVKVVHLDSKEYYIIKGFKGIVNSIAFTQLPSILLASIDDLCNLYVHAVSLHGSAISVDLVLEQLIDFPTKTGTEPQIFNLTWCVPTYDETNLPAKDSSLPYAAICVWRTGGDLGLVHLSQQKNTQNRAVSFGEPPLQVSFLLGLSSITMAYVSPNLQLLVISYSDGYLRFFRIHSGEKTLSFTQSHQLYPFSGEAIRTFYALNDPSHPTLLTGSPSYLLIVGDDKIQLRSLNYWECLQTIKFDFPCRLLPCENLKEPSFMLMDTENKILCHMKIQGGAVGSGAPVLISSVVTYPILTKTISFVVAGSAELHESDCYLTVYEYHQTGMQRLNIKINGTPSETKQDNNNADFTISEGFLSPMKLLKTKDDSLSSKSMLIPQDAPFMKLKNAYSDKKGGDSLTIANELVLTEKKEEGYVSDDESCGDASPSNVDDPISFSYQAQNETPPPPLPDGGDKEDNTDRSQDSREILNHIKYLRKYIDHQLQSSSQKLIRQIVQGQDEVKRSIDSRSLSKLSLLLEPFDKRLKCIENNQIKIIRDSAQAQALVSNGTANSRDRDEALVKKLNFQLDKLAERLVKNNSSVEKSVNLEVKKVLTSPEFLSSVVPFLESSLRDVLKSSVQECVVAHLRPHLNTEIKSLFMSVDQSFRKGTQQYLSSVEGHLTTLMRNQTSGLSESTTATILSTVSKGLQSLESRLPASMALWQENLLSTVSTSLEEINKRIQQDAKGTMREIFDTSLFPRMERLLQSMNVVPSSASSVVEDCEIKAMVEGMIRGGSYVPAFVACVDDKRGNLLHDFICRVPAATLFEGQDLSPITSSCALRFLEAMSSDTMSVPLDDWINYVQEALLHLQTPEVKCDRAQMAGVLHKLQCYLDDLLKSCSRSQTKSIIILTSLCHNSLY